MKQTLRYAPIGVIADYCSVNRVTVRRWIEGGKLPAMRLPSGHYRVSIADFRQFLEMNNMPVDGVFLSREL